MLDVLHAGHVLEPAQLGKSPDCGRVSHRRDSVKRLKEKPASQPRKNDRARLASGGPPRARMRGCRGDTQQIRLCPDSASLFGPGDGDYTHRTTPQLTRAGIHASRPGPDVLPRWGEIYSAPEGVITSQDCRRLMGGGKMVLSVQTGGCQPIIVAHVLCKNLNDLGRDSNILIE